MRPSCSGSGLRKLETRNSVTSLAWSRSRSIERFAAETTRTSATIVPMPTMADAAAPATSR